MKPTLQGGHRLGISKHLSTADCTLPPEELSPYSRYPQFRIEGVAQRVAEKIEGEAERPMIEVLF
jgi:hypothetical protein